REWAQRLVRQKAHELGIGHMRASEQAALNRTIEEMPIDEAARRVVVTEPLSTVEQRAVQIVCGAPIKGKKNRIETDAIRLAEAVNAEWFAEAPRRPGRPKGSMIGTAPESVEALPSVSEVIAATAPIIEQLAGGAASTAPRSAMIAAVLAAADSAGLQCSAAYAATLASGHRL